MKPGNELDLPMEFEDRAHEALMSVWWTAMLLKRASRATFRSEVPSEAEFNMLMALKYCRVPLTQNDLSRRLLVDKANVTGLVNRLERSGLIRRNEVPGDRRRYHITLTGKGRRLIDRVDRRYFDAVAAIMSGLTPREHAELVSLTRKMRAGLAELRGGGRA
jgi:DNA-binding MarR family transcriptional regulator